MKHLVAALLLTAGLIHLLPLPGLFGAVQLERLYGITMVTPDLEILLRHRAVMFGLLGALIVVAAFRAEWRLMAIGAGLISAVSFIVIALLVDGYGSAIHRVVVADVVAIVCLIVAAILERHAAGLGQ